MTAPVTYLLMMDPAWRPGAGDEVPPVAAMAGSWPVDADGDIGGFRPNPDYAPTDPDAPADPLDALLRTAVTGTPPLALVQLLLRDALVDVAFDESERPLVVRSPDHALCLIVTTSAPQRAAVPAPAWLRTDLLGLIGLLDDGVDVLVNPYGPVPARITGDDVRAAHLLEDDEVAEARDVLRARYPIRDAAVLPWAGGPSGQI